MKNNQIKIKTVFCFTVLFSGEGDAFRDCRNFWFCSFRLCGCCDPVSMATTAQQLLVPVGGPVSLNKATFDPNEPLDSNMFLIQTNRDY